MRNAWIITKNTALEIIRNRVFYATILFALAIVVGSLSISHFEKEVQAKLAKDISFFAITYFSIFLALFLTMEQVPNEIERKTIYFLLARPVRRFEFLLGKFLGVNLVLILNFLFMGMLLWFFLKDAPGGFDGAAVAGLFLIYLQTAILSSLVIFLSTFLSNIVSVTLALFIYFFGTTSATLLYGLKEGNHPIASTVIHMLQMALPNFDLFDLHEVVVAGSKVTLHYALVLTLYAALFSVNFLVLGYLIFESKDL